MYEKLLLIVRKLPFISGDSSSAQLLRTYIVGGFNLVFGLVLNYIFQFLILSSVEVPLRTYLPNVFYLSLVVIVSYFISRKIIFKLSISIGTIKVFRYSCRAGRCQRWRNASCCRRRWHLTFCFLCFVVCYVCYVFVFHVFVFCFTFCSLLVCTHRFHSFLVFCIYIYIYSYTVYNVVALHVHFFFP